MRFQNSESEGVKVELKADGPIHVIPVIAYYYYREIKGITPM